MIRNHWPCTILLILAFPLCLMAQTEATPPPTSEGATQAPSVDSTRNGLADPCKGVTRSILTSILAGSGRSLGKLASTTEGTPVYLGQWLTLRGCNLDLLVKSTAEAKPLQLYLNGMPLKGVDPVILHKDEKMAGVRFELVRTDDSKDTWAALLGRPSTAKVAVDVSLGPKGCGENCTTMTNPLQIHLVALRKGWATGFVAVLLLLLGVLVWLAATRALLRDRGPGSPWSLARTQMAWWTFFVVGAFLLIWMVSGSYSSLSGSVLALIGISSGTALLGAVIDDTKESQMAQRTKLETEKQGLQIRLAALSAPEIDRLAEVDRQLREMPKITEKSAKNWLFDMLSDEDGISFHRFQIVIWTVVLTAIFVVKVYSTLSMPEFDAPLLGLTGISAGTYLGFKFPEKKV